MKILPYLMPFPSLLAFLFVRLERTKQSIVTIYVSRIMQCYMDSFNHPSEPVSTGYD